MVAAVLADGCEPQVKAVVIPDMDTYRTVANVLGAQAAEWVPGATLLTACLEMRPDETTRH